jgi:predicted RNA-binding Zn-ribbon protein involved in translation (DUF1610 family)
MGALVFQCPKSGEAIRSGIQTNLESLERVRDLPVRLFCPTCRTVHVMRAHDGQIDESPVFEAEAA